MCTIFYYNMDCEIDINSTKIKTYPMIHNVKPQLLIKSVKKEVQHWPETWKHDAVYNYPDKNLVAGINVKYELGKVGPQEWSVYIKEDSAIVENSEIGRFDTPQKAIEMLINVLNKY